MKHVTSVARPSYSLYVKYIYIYKITYYQENYRFVRLKYIFRSEEASGALVSTLHCS